MMNINNGFSYRQKGVYIVWLVFFIPIFVGMLALALDIGFYMSEIKRAQTVADAAAMDLALSDPSTPYNDLVVAANQALAYNAVNTWTITVGDPNTKKPEPTAEQSAYFSVKTPGSYVGVTVMGTSPLFFAYWLGEPFSIKVHSVAKL